MAEDAPISSLSAAFNPAAHVHSITQLQGAPPAQTPVADTFAANEKADVVIIGGGYTGLSAALHLAQMAKQQGKGLNIVLLEAGTVGSAASGKSGGHVAPEFQEHDMATVLKFFPTPEQGKNALDIANAGPALVKKIIAENNIDADLRDGYVMLDGKKQTPILDGSAFGIEPYPFILGMAQAARNLGVKIYEHTPVTDIVETVNGLEVKTSRGSIAAADVLAAGGHKMAENIPYLKPQRSKTIELLASTIMTDPLPPAVIQKILPSVGGARVPFATDNVDVAYGTIDRDGRIIFGANVGALKTSPEGIAKKLFKLFPNLQEAYKQETGRNLGFKTLVSNEPLNFTTDLMPNMGRMGANGHVRFVHALGGHGIALGTVLGKTAAEDIFGSLTKNPALQEDFSLLSGVKHSWTPSWKPLRTAVAYTAVESVKAGEKIKNLFKKH